MPKCCDRLIRNHKPHNHNKPKHTENTKKTRHTKTHLKNTTKYFKNAMKHEWVWLGTLRELWLWINIKRKCVPKINHSAIVRTLLSLSLSLSLSTMAISLQLCRIPTRTDLFSPENFAGPAALRCRKPLSVKCTADDSSSSSSASVAVDSDFDAKVFRKNLTRSKNYNRKGFGYKEETLELMNREYTSESHSLSQSKVHIKLS